MRKEGAAEKSTPKRVSQLDLGMLRDETNGSTPFDVGSDPTEADQETAQIQRFRGQISVARRSSSLICCSARLVGGAEVLEPARSL